MALTRAAVTETAPSKAKGKAKKHTLVLVGKSVTEYNEKYQALKSLKGEVDVIKAELLTVGLDEISKVNCNNADNPVSSIKLEDENGSDVTYIIQDRYREADLDLAEDLFEELDEDINEFVHEKVSASFDSSIFYVDGEFNKEIYDVYLAAIKTATRKLQKSGILGAEVEAPIAIKKQVRVKDNFHARRWKAFGAEAQPAVQNVLKAVESIRAGTIATAA